MITVFLYTALIGAVISVVGILAVIGVARFVAGKWWFAVSFALLVVAGTVPATVLGVLWYAQEADYLWAISGPGWFGQIDGGKWILGYPTLTAVWTGACWLSVIAIGKRQLVQTGPALESGTSPGT